MKFAYNFCISLYFHTVFICTLVYYHFKLQCSLDNEGAYVLQNSCASSCHKLAFVGFAFCGTNCRMIWLVEQQIVRSIIRSRHPATYPP